MLPPGAVTIVVNGSIVSSFLPARIVGGRVVAPLTPVVAALASRTAYDPAAATVAVERSDLRVVVPVAFVEHDVPFVELGRVARGIGGTVAFDAASKTLTIAFAGAGPIVTPAPFDPRAPQTDPRAVFTPPPRPEPSRGIATGIPRPRRTAIPVIPSQPVVAPPDSPDPPATNPRR